LILRFYHDSAYFVIVTYHFSKIFGGKNVFYGNLIFPPKTDENSLLRGKTVPCSP
jgi:hypothetical protein